MLPDNHKQVLSKLMTYEPIKPIKHNVSLPIGLIVIRMFAIGAAVIALILYLMVLMK